MPHSHQTFNSSDDDDTLQPYLHHLVFGLVLMTHYIQKAKQRRTSTKYPAVKETFETLTSVYSDADFYGAFRMGRSSFNTLYHTLLKSSHISERSPLDTRTIQAKVRVAIGLRIMAGASVHDVMLAYKVSKSSVNNCFKSFIAAVTETMTLPGLPTDEAELEKLSLGFKTSRKVPNPFSGCVGALDGICMRIKKPRWFENPASFFCRKGFYSIPVQALVDSSYRFLDFSAVAVGSTNDSLAYEMSPLARLLNAGMLLLGYFIVGDNAYLLSNSLLVPFAGKNLSTSKSATNFFLSSMRIHVEQAFGILKRRWRVFYNGELNYGVEDCVPIIAVGMILHNFCINCEGIPEYIYEEEELAQIRSESKAWHLRVKEKSGAFYKSHVGLDREFIRSLLHDIATEKGLLRPTSNL